MAPVFTLFPTGPALATLAVDPAHSVSFALSGAAVPGKVTGTGDRMLYSKVLPDVDLQLQALNGEQRRLRGGRIAAGLAMKVG